MRLSHAAPSGRKGPERLVFADAVFFRPPKSDDQELLVVQALIALLVYQKPLLAESLLLRYDNRCGTSLVRTLVASTA